jgi:hypothetical protein
MRIARMFQKITRMHPQKRSHKHTHTHPHPPTHPPPNTHTKGEDERGRARERERERDASASARAHTHTRQHANTNKDTCHEVDGEKELCGRWRVPPQPHYAPPHQCPQPPRPLQHQPLTMTAIRSLLHSREQHRVHVAGGFRAGLQIHYHRASCGRARAQGGECVCFVAQHTQQADARLAGRQAAAHARERARACERERERPADRDMNTRRTRGQREKRGVVENCQAATCQEATVAQIYSCGHQQSDAERHAADLPLDLLSNQCRASAIASPHLRGDCHSLPAPRRLQLHQLHHHHLRVQVLLPALLLALYTCARGMAQGDSRDAHILKRQCPSIFHI